MINARYVPMTIPVANISGSFQLSGIGDGLTRSLDMVMIVPDYKLTISDKIIDIH